MFFADYHTHSHLSPDGENTIAELCRSAIGAGLSELCITDHSDVNGWNGTPYDFPLEEFFVEFAEAKEEFGGRLKLISGSEVGQATQNKEAAQKLYRDPRYDFIIGSLHNLADELDFYLLPYPDMDTCHSYIRRYFAELLDFVNFTGFDVLGHLSYPLRYMRGRGSMDIDFSGYYDEIRTIFKALIENGNGIEINTSGLRQELGSTMPSPDLVKLYRECGGEIITVGSDAHQAHHIGAGIREGYDILRSSGFKYVTVYSKREPKFIKI